MKKIALVTCYFQHNYGSQLQALATQMICDKLEWPNETICIEGLKSEINKAKYGYFLSRILDIHTILDKMATVRKVIAKKFNADYARNLRVRDDLSTASPKPNSIFLPPTALKQNWAKMPTSMQPSLSEATSSGSHPTLRQTTTH